MATSHHRQPTAADLLREVHERGLEKFSLGGVTLWMNPQSYVDATEQVQRIAQTDGGYIDYDYGASPTVFTISGTTGNAGVDGPGGMREMERFRPQPGKPLPLIPMRYPAEGRGTIDVKVNSFKRRRETSSGAKLWLFYDMEARAFPHGLAVTAINVTGRVGSTPFPLPNGGVPIATTPLTAGSLYPRGS